MEKQLICYIDPFKFYKLLGKEKAGDHGFSGNDPSQIGYINKDGKPEFGDYSQLKAEVAAILLVPDTYNLLKEEYKPVIKFKVLYHGATNEKLRVDPLTELTNCEGSEKSSESEYTIYHDIAKLIDSKKAEDIMCFDDIYGGIKITNKKLESALNFLHECLISKPDIPHLKDFDIKSYTFNVEEKGVKVKKTFTDLVDRLADPPINNIKTFEDLRDGLLEWAMKK